jgi:hypothetical protein
MSFASGYFTAVGPMSSGQLAVVSKKFPIGAPL